MILNILPMLPSGSKKAALMGKARNQIPIEMARAISIEKAKLMAIDQKRPII